MAHYFLKQIDVSRWLDFVSCIPIPSARQHPIYGDWSLRGIIFKNCSVLGCVTQCSQSAAHSYQQFRSIRLGLSHWDPYAVHRGGCLVLYYCNMVE